MKKMKIRKLAGVLAAVLAITSLQLPVFGTELMADNFKTEEGIKPLEGLGTEAVCDTDVITDNNEGISNIEDISADGGYSIKFEGDGMKDAPKDAEVIEDTAEAGDSLDSVKDMDDGKAAAMDSLDAAKSVADGAKGDDIDDGDDDSDEYISKGSVSYNISKLTSALDGVENDPQCFSASVAIINNEPVIKLKWNVKQASAYTLERFDAQGTTDIVDVRIKKKAYVDYEAFAEDDNTSIYLLRAYMKDGAEFDYVTIPSSEMLYSNGGTIDESIQLVFSKAYGPVKYLVEKTGAKDRKFLECEEMMVYDADLIPEGTKLTGGDMKGDNITLFKKPAVAAQDTGVDAGERYLYRVTSILDLPGIDVKGLTSKAVRAQTADYAAPMIADISNGNDKHPICYKDGKFYIQFAESGVPNSVMLSIDAATESKTSFKRIVEEELSECTKTFIDGTETYIIEYDNFEPEVTKYYRVSFTLDKYKSAYSLPYEATCHYDPVEIVYAGEKDLSSVELRWYAEDCALKYIIYRTEDVWDTEAKALAAAKDYPMSSFKKIATINNLDVRNGSEHSYVDTKGVALGVYHAYKIVPQNKKAAPFDSEACALVAAQCYPASPTEVEFESKGMHNFSIKWNESKGAQVYKIQRTNTANYLGEPIWDEDEYGLVDIKEWEFSSGDENVWVDENNIVHTEKPFNEKKNGYHSFTQSAGYGEDNVKLGQHYYYRVLAACKVEGSVMWAEEDTSNYVEAYLQPKAVQNMQVELSTAAAVLTGNTSCVTYEIPDDCKSVARYEVSYSINNKDALETHATSMVSFNAVKIPDAQGKTYKKQYSGVARGKVYYFAVRPVYEGDGMVIKGNWKTEKFVLPTEIFVYPDGQDKKYKPDSTVYTEIGTSEKTVYVAFAPSDATYKNVRATTSNTNFQIGRKSGNSYINFNPDYPLTEETKGKFKTGNYLFKVKMTGNITYSASTTITVAGTYTPFAAGEKKEDAAQTSGGLVTSTADSSIEGLYPLKKMLYFKSTPPTTTTTTTK